MTQNIDPELVDDRETQETEVESITLPEYNSSEFEVSDDYEWDEPEDDGDEDA